MVVVRHLLIPNYKCIIITIIYEMNNKDTLTSHLLDNIECMFHCLVILIPMEVFFSRKSPARNIVNHNNTDRVLSVSGKLRCARCNDELGNRNFILLINFLPFIVLFQDKARQWLLNLLDYIIISNVFVVAFVIFHLHLHLKVLMFECEIIDFIAKIVSPMKMVRNEFS